MKISKKMDKTRKKTRNTCTQWAKLKSEKRSKCMLGKILSNKILEIIVCTRKPTICFYALNLKSSPSHFLCMQPSSSRLAHIRHAEPAISDNNSFCLFCGNCFLIFLTEQRSSLASCLSLQDFHNKGKKVTRLKHN